MITPGFPETQRKRAAQLYWQAFKGKLNPLMGPDPKALAFFERVLDPDHAISALAPDGTLLGIAGFKTAKGAFVGGTLSDLAQTYGWLGTLWRAPLLSLLERDLAEDILLMDGICVSDHARGQGIGTKLLNAIKAQAHTRNLSQVRLDVINTNPHARALYERQGFTPGEIQHLGPLRHLFGFKSATTMIWQTP